MNFQSRVQEESQKAEFELAPPDDQPQLSFLELWQVLRVRRREFMLASLGLFIVILVVTFTIPPRYEGEARVMLDIRQNNVVNVQQVLTGLPVDQAAILDQVQILQSRELAGRVVDKLRLDADPEFTTPGALAMLGFLNPFHYLRPDGQAATPAQTREIAREAVIDRFLSRLSVSQVQLSTAIDVAFQSRDPATAALITNTLADAYIEDQLNAKLEATQRATQWISGRLGKLAQDARVAEAALQRYKTEHHLTDVATQSGTGTVSVLDQQIGAATTQLMQAQMDRAQAEATLARVKSMVNSGHAAEVSQVVSSQLISQLRQQEAEVVRKVAELSARYGSEHPKMLDLMAEKRDLEAKINIEIQRVVGTAANDVAVASAREAALQQSLKSLESQSGDQGQARVEERELEAAATSSRALYDSFVERAKQIEQEQTLQIPEARIISHSPIPQGQSFPPLMIVFAGSIPLSLLFGVLVATMLERLDNGFRTSARLEEVLKLPVLATLPDLTTKKLLGGKQKLPGNVTAADEVIDKPLGAYAESVRGMQMGLTLSNVDEVPKVVVVTSAIPGEGKTTITLSLARHVAQTGRKVVLVDGDLRRPSLLQAAGIDKAEFDLVDVLRGVSALDRALCRDPKSSVALLPVTKHVKNAPDLLESEAMRKIVTQLSSVFDMVVVDSAPILPVNDTRVLARLGDAVLFVVRWESTPRKAASDAVRILRDSRAPLAGAVLSCADAKRFSYYSFGNESSYYSRYYE